MQVCAPNQQVKQIRLCIIFRKALEQDPSRGQSLYELANIEIKQKNFDNALKLLQKHQQLSFNDPALVAVTLKAAQKAGRPEVVAEYKLQLSKLNSINAATGDNNDDNSNNG